MKKHLLFVCTSNLDRSPCCEYLFKKHPKFEAKSCGFYPDEEGAEISKELIDWADIIFLMENEHQRLFYQQFSKPENKEIIVLDVQNIYARYDPKLLRLLKIKLGDWL